jgi:hypothetical protein
MSRKKSTYIYSLFNIDCHNVNVSVSVEFIIRGVHSIEAWMQPASRKTGERKSCVVSRKVGEENSENISPRGQAVGVS